jgi:thioester reductase-like protein
MRTIFFTGFPGFLGSRLLPPVLQRAEGAHAVCLIQSKFSDLAHRRVGEILSVHPDLEGRIRLVTGDITRPDLALDAATAEQLRSETVEIYHLAAVYDLSVSEEVGQKVNVDGTRYLLDFADACRESGETFRRFQYVSTCYVSGRHPGEFTENDLDVGQSFNNFYESTKYEAEVLVQERMKSDLPATVYRPAIVVGDSRTGATQKFDGPYFIIRWLLRQKGVAVMPVVGDPTKYRVNVVPRDFVIDALVHLSGLEVSSGKVYQLADPAPLTVAEMMDEIARHVDRKVVRMKLPKSVAKGMIEYVPFVGRVMQIPAASVDYFTHPTTYTSENTQRDLEESGIACPPFPSYVAAMMRFVEEHPEIGSEAMV